MQDFTDRSLIDPRLDRDRLVDLHRLLRDMFAGKLLPVALPQKPVQVLDLQCGPGPWTTDAARENPHFQITGVDSREENVSYAWARAELLSLSNVSFQTDTILGGLPFSDQQFDIIHACFLAQYVKWAEWPAVLKECLRLSKNEGLFCTTETLALQSVTSPHFNLMINLIKAALQEHFPVHQTLAQLPALITQVTQCAVFARQHLIDFSSASQWHARLVAQFERSFLLLQPFLEQQAAQAQPGTLLSQQATKAQLDTLYQRVMDELHYPTFRGSWRVLTCWCKLSSSFDE